MKTDHKAFPLVLLTGFVLLSLHGAGQSDDTLPSEEVFCRRNAVYLELMGNAGFYSLNYERMYPMSSISAAFLRVGTSLIDIKSTPHQDFILAAEAGLRFGSCRHALDFGAGFSNRIGYSDSWIVGRIGYRFSGRRGLFIRISPLMVIMNLDPQGEFDGYWMAGAIGFSF
ncbi:MAG TPA: hypothetical protein P5228_11905 [Bacteroidales bacterium]|nr:hypothetical protein [Bacteroidales bacterium]HRZ49777.1 hypothetical protein [Bacteroidales bacterium]